MVGHTTCCLIIRGQHIRQHGPRFSRAVNWVVPNMVVPRSLSQDVVKNVICCGCYYLVVQGSKITQHITINHSWLLLILTSFQPNPLPYNQLPPLTPEDFHTCRCSSKASSHWKALPSSEMACRCQQSKVNGWFMIASNPWCLIDDN